MLDEVIFLDTIPAKPGVKCDKIKYISVAHMFAEAISHIYMETSVSPCSCKESGDRNPRNRGGGQYPPLFRLFEETDMMFLEMKPAGASWVLVCLGNPGEKYENTRHNVGFMVADELGERQHAPIQKLKFKALTNVFTISGEKVLVMKPVTYMNLSGEAVRQAADFL